MPEKVEECVESVLEDNPDYSESRAWAICKAQHESAVDRDDVDVEQLADVEFEAAELDELASTAPTWTRHESELGVAWVDTETGLAVFDGVEDGGLEQQADPMTNGHQLDPGTGKGTCESTGEEIEAETMGDLTQDCPHCGEPLSVLGEAQQQESDAFAVDVIEIVQEGDEGPVADGALLGVGADMPNAGVYVDWNIDAWPDDEQLAEPHVSDYGSIEDLEQATGGTVEVVETVTPTVGSAETGEDDVDQQAVTIQGLSQEAQEAIADRYNVTVTEVAHE